MTIVRICTTSLMPVLLSVILTRIEQKTDVREKHLLIWEIAIGILFGCLAILSTEFGINVGPYVINARDAAPLCAGLLFGAPSGILAGMIGGIERWFAVYWGIGTYTRIACSLGTIIAGLTGAMTRRLLYKDSRPSVLHGLIIGLSTEIMHMFMVFLTNMDDVARAFDVVAHSSAYMIPMNSLSVGLAVLLVNRMLGLKQETRRESMKLSVTFQKGLLVCIFLAFILTSFFTNFLETNLSRKESEELIRLNLDDAVQDVNDESDRRLLEVTRSIAQYIDEIQENGQKKLNADDLEKIMEPYHINEINLVDPEGIITETTNWEYVGFDMRSGKQSRAFLPLLNGTEKEIVRPYETIAFDKSIQMKYAGVILKNGGFVQVGCDSEQFYQDLFSYIVDSTKNRHIGQEGCIVIATGKGTILSTAEGREGNTLSDIGLAKINMYTPGKVFRTEIYGEPSFCLYQEAEGYYIVGIRSEHEAFLSRNMTVTLLVYIEILVFSAFFVLIYAMLDRVVVRNMHKVNEALGQITRGNLDTAVNVRETAEFTNLSADINSTVDTLKRYIREAEERIDQELEFARQIQYSALPSVFPPYPNRRDFEIFASMDPAKEVGGDFYDFYLLDEYTLGFLAADVSGKGIPAAMFMMTAKTLIKGLAESGLPVNEVLTQANAKLCENNEAEMFVTCWMGILDLRSGLIRFANAGHNPPVVRKENELQFLKSKVNFVLAGMDGVRYRLNEYQLEPGDTIFLYTDGVTEATNAENELFGDDRLLESAKKADGSSVEAFCRSIRADIDAFVAQAPQFDDMTMVYLRWNGPQKTEEGFAERSDGDNNDI